jgi:predicted Fe-Mo cluster-binding NifX family protein
MSTTLSSNGNHRIAVASNDGLTLHRHFGRADQFQIYDVDANGYSFLGVRKVTHPCADGGHSTAAFDSVLDVLSDCEAVVVAKIGPGAAEYLMFKGMRIFEGYGMLEDVLKKIVSSRALDNGAL